MTIDSAATYCQRCREIIDPDTIQCDRCGELQRSERPSSAFPKFATDTHRSIRQIPSSNVPYEQPSQKVRSVPIGIVARWTGVVAAGLLLIAGLCFALAWAIDSLTLPLMEASIIVAIGAVVAVVAGGLVAISWKFLNLVDEALADRSFRREREAKQSALNQKAWNRARPAQDNVESAEPDNAQRSKPPAAKPSPYTIIFAVLGIIFGTMGMVISLIPFLGLFTFLPLVSASIFTLIAWVLSYYERSQKLLPLVGSILILIAALGMIVQYAYWSSAKRIAEEDSKRIVEELQKAQVEQMKAQQDLLFDSLNRADKQLQQSMGTVLRSLPRPPATPTHRRSR